AGADKVAANIKACEWVKTSVGEGLGLDDAGEVPFGPHDADGGRGVRRDDGVDVGEDVSFAVKHLDAARGADEHAVVGRDANRALNDDLADRAVALRGSAGEVYVDPGEKIAVDL